MELTLIPWSDDDLRVLERANSIDMTRFLGGVESNEDLAARHALYVGFAEAGGGRMFRVEVDGESAGYAGWWDEVHEGMPVFEVGCAVGPERQGRGVATEALTRVIELAQASEPRRDRRVRRRGQRRLERAVPAAGLRTARRGHLPHGRRRFRREHLGDRREDDDVDVTLHRWSPGDQSVLERANTPEMTRFLGGPETPEKLLERHENYLRHWESGHAHMFRIDVDGVPAGSIGWWRIEHKGTPAYETGWGVEPEWQGRGVARLALRRLIADVRADGERTLLVAYPGVENPGSNALCRGAGFTHTGSETAPWRGGELTFNIWELDMSPLDLAGREPEVDERFAGGHARP